MTRRIHIAGILMVVGLLMWGCSKSDAQTTEITVNTAVCDMCAHNIEQAVGKVEGVKSVVVDMESKIAKVSYNASQTSVASIEDAIVATGYAANDKPADKAAYEELPDCCKIHIQETDNI